MPVLPGDQSHLDRIAKGRRGFWAPTMRSEFEFDKKLELRKPEIPSDVQEAATFVVDTLKLSQAVAQQLFGERATTPAITFEIYDRIMLRMKEGCPPKH